MKILSVSGKNLASLAEEFRLDFTEEPLASAGIFAITGETGSGKSTILDALCLALYSKIPRLESAGTAKIPDVKDQTITLENPCSILRKGTTEGYAEVQFLAVDGKRYASAWSVSRTKNGTLNSAKISVQNLSDNKPLQGTKKELLQQLETLLGLSFGQFTRSVLLAQGSFAAFLKAGDAEKAEILEKLTGTEIYSEVSQRIYERTSEAKKEVETIKSQIDAVQMLSEEDVLKLNGEAETLQNEIQTLEKKRDTLTKTKNYLAEKTKLESALAQAETELHAADAAVEQAKPREDFIKQIETAQEIRDDFNALQRTKEQLAEHKETLARKSADETNVSVHLTQAENEFKRCGEELEQIRQEFDKIKPDIDEAKKLDVRVTENEKHYAAASKEDESAANAVQTLEEKIAGIQDAAAGAQRRKETAESWIAEHRHYEPLAAQKEFILAKVKEYKKAKKDIRDNQKTLDTNGKALEKENAELEHLKTELERLNHLLPAEIAVLRAKLRDGKPCPVCGSLHHHVSQQSESQTLEEQKINDGKKDTAQKIIDAETAVQQRRTQTAQTQTALEKDTERQNEAVAVLKQFLPETADLDGGGLAAQIETQADEWKSNTAGLADAEKNINANKPLLESETENLAKARRDYQTKQSQKAAALADVTALRQKRAGLLGGQKTDEAEKTLEEKQKTAAENVKVAEEKKNTLAQQQARLKGETEQILEAVKSSETQQQRLQNNVSDWLNGHENFSGQQLAQYFAEPPQQLENERKALKDLRSAQTQAASVFNERKNNLAKHLTESPVPESPGPESPEPEYPVKAESIISGSLDEELSKTETLLNDNRNRTAEINAALKDNDEKNQRAGKLRTEFDAKTAAAENWSRLNTVFGSADGAKFKKIAQQYTLDHLLAYSNKHLEDLNPRYRLLRVADSMSLLVIDLDMGSEQRAVQSLSGGESFLVSLALALGLSSFSSHRMNLESLFIDEGFGSLDSNTLSAAMESLEQLQNQGRKIGIISHVDVIKERLGVKVCVTKTSGGSSRITVTAGH
ncbi:MAG: AAA family ATPase [Planctomycetaceae bacterium]|jgi:exonuclease SbcC|nr:AAA family ATPase [Planctomycetaceae bacterium]